MLLPAPRLRVCVPPPKTSVVVAGTVKLPVLVPPLLRLSVPLFTSTAPLLLNANWTSVTPVPADLRKVPFARLLKVGVPESRNKMASDCTSNRPALLTTAALPTRQKGLLAPVRVAPPLIFRVRPFNSVKLLAVMARPPLAVVWPLPLMMPPVQVVAPLIVTLSEPDNVPPLMVRVVALMASPLEKLRLPPDTVKAAPTASTLTPALKLAAVPPVDWVAPLML